jgi:AraC-like DNA-binding protein
LGDHRLARWAQLEHRSGTSVTDSTLSAFGRAAVLALEDPEHASQFFIDHVLNGICSYLLETYCSQSKRRLMGGLAPWQERRAKDLIDFRLGSDLSLDALADDCGLSVAHFARAFKQSVGETPHRWLVRRRIDTAQRLLIHTKRPLVQIAADCGFTDQAHFTNIFRRMVGVPPGAFRRQRNAGNRRSKAAVDGIADDPIETD